MIVTTNSGAPLKSASGSNLTAFAPSSPTNVDPVSGWGLKTLVAVGSISQGTNQLVLQSDPGFSVNDYVIVEIGAESGLGIRGTIGVGGVYPLLSYATTAALLADTSQVNNTVAWAKDTGDIYQWTTSNSTWTQQTNYYLAKAVPLSLLAQITAKSGTTLTLSVNASATATNANVYFDNFAVFNTNFSALTAPTNINFPAGTFCFSNNPQVNNSNYCSILGSGIDITILKFPKGTTSGSITFDNSVRPAAQNFTILGNWADNGFGLNFQVVSQTDLGFQNGNFDGGLFFNSCTGGYAEYVKVHNNFCYGLESSYSADVWAVRCQVVNDTGAQAYFQWAYEWANSTAGGTMDCSFTCPNLMGAVEAFESYYVRHIGFTSTNGAASFNNSAYWLLDRPNITITPNSQLNAGSFSSADPIVNINLNIGDSIGNLGGVVRNQTIVQQGFINASNDLLEAIVIGTNNVSVTGTYPDAAGPQGYLSSPNGVTGQEPPVGVRADSNAVTVSGIRVVGIPASPWYAIDVASGTVENCVADTIETGPTQSNNQSNATWEASH